MRVHILRVSRNSLFSLLKSIKHVADIAIYMLIFFFHYSPAHITAEASRYEEKCVQLNFPVRNEIHCIIV